MSSLPRQVIADPTTGRNIQVPSLREGAYRVQARQAKPGKLSSLAGALSQFNEGLKAYGNLTEVAGKSGETIGQLQASAAKDLNASEENLKKVEEKLLAEGKLSRMELFGFRRAYKTGLAKRQATEATVGLNRRLRESVENLDNENFTADSIINEEAAKYEFEDPYLQAGFNSVFSTATARFKQEFQARRDEALYQNYQDNEAATLTQELIDSDVDDIQLKLEDFVDGKEPSTGEKNNGFRLQKEDAEAVGLKAIVGSVEFLLSGKPNATNIDRADKIIDKMLEIPMLSDSPEARRQIGNLQDRLETVSEKLSADSREALEDLTQNAAAITHAMNSNNPLAAADIVSRSLGEDYEDLAQVVEDYLTEKAADPTNIASIMFDLGEILGGSAEEALQASFGDFSAAEITYNTREAPPSKESQAEKYQEMVGQLEQGSGDLGSFLQVNGSWLSSSQTDELLKLNTQKTVITNAVGPRNISPAEAKIKNKVDFEGRRIISQEGQDRLTDPQKALLAEAGQKAANSYIPQFQENLTNLIKEGLSTGNVTINGTSEPYDETKIYNQYRIEAERLTDEQIDVTDFITSNVRRILAVNTTTETLKTTKAGVDLSDIHGNIKNALLELKKDFDPAQSFGERVASAALTWNVDKRDLASYKDYFKVVDLLKDDKLSAKNFTESFKDRAYMSSKLKTMELLADDFDLDKETRASVSNVLRSVRKDFGYLSPEEFLDKGNKIGDFIGGVPLLFSGDAHYRKFADDVAKQPADSTALRTLRKMGLETQTQQIQFMEQQQAQLKFFNE